MAQLFGEFSPMLIMVMVFGLVEFSKKMGVSGNWLLLLSMILGVGLGVLFQMGELYPAVNQWLQIGVFGVLFGLSASGVYDFAKARFPKAETIELAACVEDAPPVGRG